MALTISNTTFPAGDIIISGITDAVGAVEASIGSSIVQIVEGSFEFNVPNMDKGTYNLTIDILDNSKKVIDSDSFEITITEPSTTTGTTGTTTGTTTGSTTTGSTTGTTTGSTTTGTSTTTNTGGNMANSAAGQALVDKNSSSIQNFVPRYTPMVESDTKNIEVYPGSQTGFAPLSASAHSASKADEFKIMSDEALAANPSAGFTGGRGTGNPENFGRYPARALMQDVRGEFFPKLGDFDAKTLTQYPLGRTADLLENATIPVGFTEKDPTTGYSTKTIRGGANSSPIQTSGFTF